MQGSEEDRKLRELLKSKDMQFQNQLKQQMESEQQNLKGYFKEFKKPTDKDPTKIKKSQAPTIDRSLVFKQAMKPFTLFSTFYEFWQMRCATHEQNYTLQICKDNYLKNMGKGIVGSMLLTGFVSFRFRNVLPPLAHAFGLATALMSGFLYGSLTSTRFTLEQFEKLGDGFQLGRIAQSQISKYRMDLPVNRVPNNQTA